MCVIYIQYIYCIYYNNKTQLQNKKKITNIKEQKEPQNKPKKKLNKKKRRRNNLN